MPHFFSSLVAQLAQHRLFYGWVIVAVAFITIAIGVSARSAFSLLYPPILDEFGWQRSTTAATFSIGFLVSVVGTPIIGRLMDKRGPQWVMSGGAILVATGLIATAWVETPWQMYLTLGVGVIGGSVAISYTGHGAFLANWFARQRSLAVGIAFAGAGLGGLILFPIIQWLIDGPGWRYACVAMGVLVFVVVLPLNLVFPRNAPADLGLLPDGDDAVGQAASKPSLQIVDHEWARTEWTLSKAMRTGRYWYVFLAFAFGMYSWYAILVHQTQFIVDIGNSPALAALALSAVPLFGVVGQISCGYLADRIGREWVWTIGSFGFFICYLLLFALAQENNTVLLAAMVLSQGLLGYAVTPVFPSIPADLFQGSNYGSIFGSLGVASGLGAAFGPWMTGKLFDWYGNYDVAFIIGALTSLLSILFIWLAGPSKVRRVAGRHS